MSELEGAIEAAARRVRNLLGRNEQIGEENTKAGLIDPVLHALGWDIHDPDEVHREYRYRGQGNPVDYALLIDRKPVIFVEAKPLNANLRDPKWRAQVVNYANTAGVEWCVLSDGNLWHVYKSNAPGDLDRKLFLETSLCATGEVPPSLQARSVLELLSKARLPEMEPLWQALHVNRTAEKALLGLVADPDPGLVRLLAKRSELAKRDVKDWLLRAKVTVETSLGAPPRVQDVAERRPRPRSRGAYRTKAERRGEADTIVVPAREDGFQRTFLGENRWYAIRLHEPYVKQFRYIAAYRVKPVSAITHCAEIASIERWQDSGKWVVNFKGPAQPIGPLGFTPDRKVKTFQNLRFTTFDRLQEAKTLDEAFE